MKALKFLSEALERSFNNIDCAILIVKGVIAAGVTTYSFVD